jgi:hypothetical protein
VGFLIRDRLGNDVFGTNTLNLGIATRTYKAGEFMEVAFSLPLNLGPGNYSLTLAIHAGTDHREGNHDWCDNLLAFTIVPHWPFAFAGVAALTTTAEISDQVKLLTRDCPWGQPIDFSETGNAQRFQAGGWCLPERSHCWTQGHEAILSVRLPPGGARLVAELFPFIPPGGKAQQVQVGCGESVLADWEVAQPRSVEAEIPAALRSDSGELKLWWRMPGAASPASAGVGTDARVLALAFQRITFHPLDESHR